MVQNRGFTLGWAMRDVLLPATKNRKVFITNELGQDFAEKVVQVQCLCVKCSLQMISPTTVWGRIQTMVWRPCAEKTMSHALRQKAAAEAVFIRGFLRGAEAHANPKEQSRSFLPPVKIAAKPERRQSDFLNKRRRNANGPETEAYRGMNSSAWMTNSG